MTFVPAQRGRAVRWIIPLGLLLILAGPARAQQDTKAQARALIKSGDTSYRLAKFDQALADYSAAFKLHHHPALLFNLAQCHRQLKQHEKSVFYYKLYLSDWERLKPGTQPPYEAEVKGHIAAISAHLEQQARADAAGKAAASTPAPPLASQPAVTPAVKVPVVPARPRPRRNRVWLAAGISTAALAAAALAMGVAYDLDSQDQPHGSVKWADAANIGLTGYILAASLAVASGISWYFYAGSGAAPADSAEQPPAAAAALGITPLPGGAAVGGCFSF